jgi:hypothetical protein
MGRKPMVNQPYIVSVPDNHGTIHHDSAATVSF